MYTSRKKKLLNIRIRADLHEGLKEYAAATGQTITDIFTSYVEKLLREYRSVPTGKPLSIIFEVDEYR